MCSIRQLRNLEITWKEEIVAYFVVLPSYVLERLRKIVKDLASTSHNLSQTLKWDILNMLQ
jgi:hypothetical protein